jgi:inorganic pyrophosphatase
MYRSVIGKTGQLEQIKKLKAEFLFEKRGFNWLDCYLKDDPLVRLLPTETVPFISCAILFFIVFYIVYKILRFALFYIKCAIFYLSPVPFKAKEAPKDKFFSVLHDVPLSPKKFQYDRDCSYNIVITTSKWSRECTKLNMLFPLNPIELVVKEMASNQVQLFNLGFFPQTLDKRNRKPVKVIDLSVKRRKVTEVFEVDIVGSLESESGKMIVLAASSEDVGQINTNTVAWVKSFILLTTRLRLKDLYHQRHPAEAFLKQRHEDWKTEMMNCNDPKICWAHTISELSPRTKLTFDEAIEVTIFDDQTKRFFGKEEPDPKPET